MAAVSDADYKPCPHCGRELHKWTRAKHVRTCPKRPEIADALRTALTGADGYAVSPEEYVRVRTKRLPTHVAITHTFGSWRAACAHFGLTPRSAISDGACPHCGRTCTGYGLANHVRKCPRRPEIATALREALTSAEDGCMASREEYDAVRMDGLPHGNLLAEHFGGWPNVAAHFGLTMRSREATNRRRGVGIARGWANRRMALAGGGGAPEDDPLLVGAVRVRTDYGEGDGLAYYGTRQMDGRTVYMLR